MTKSTNEQPKNQPMPANISVAHVKKRSKIVANSTVLKWEIVADCARAIAKQNKRHTAAQHPLRYSYSGQLAKHAVGRC
jgi:hypothetical protein